MPRLPTKGLSRNNHSNRSLTGCPLGPARNPILSRDRKGAVLAIWHGYFLTNAKLKRVPKESPLEVYQRRAEELRRAAEETGERHRSASRGLVLLVVVATVVLYQAWSTKSLPSWAPLLVVLPAGYLFRRMAGSQRQAQETRCLEAYYRCGIARLTLDWEALDEGQDFRDAEHFYSNDLDLFGRGSLFQLVCSARTHAGRETLAAWMKTPASREEVLARRAAVAELAGRQDLRERLAAAGKSMVSDCRPETFRRWLAEVFSPFPGWAPAAALLLAVAALALPALYWTHALAPPDFWQTAAGVGLLEIVLVRFLSGRAGPVLESLRRPSIELPILCELLRIVESGNFSSPKLAALEARLGSGAGSASAHMRRLWRLVRWLDLRDNPMFALVSYGLLWATQFAMAIDRWRARHGRELTGWLQVLGEFEALISLSAYAREHPDDVLPGLLEGEPEFDARGLAHPLLNAAAAVRNDVQLGSGTRFLIVSGSNMSGKSTFLRAVGQNAVLAWMGAPVRCRRLRASRLAIGAAIRSQDSLTDGRSHFFAEMDRLRRMIAAADDGPMLFLADEILSGTNSHDRRIAAEWVVRALLLRGAIGVITTHDLALTEIAANGLPGRNVHFEDTGEGGDLHFDYTLRDGVLTRSNALNIAHLLGIDAAAGVTG